MSKNIDSLFDESLISLASSKPVPAPATVPGHNPATVPWHNAAQNDVYNASSIRVLEGLEPVRLRPGMYIGGTDNKALHHLFSEVIDNAMDEAVAGHASIIEVTLDENGCVSVSDNGRGIPVEEHPQMPNKSTLEVILTQLHSGGKFDGKAYETSGGLHGVGISVVNALSDFLEVEIVRHGTLYKQLYSRGVAQTPLETVGPAKSRRGTLVRFHPDPEIFGQKAAFDAERLYKMTRSKAYLFGGVKIKWSCAASRLPLKTQIEEETVFYFADGLKDYILHSVADAQLITENLFTGKTKKRGGHGATEWAIAWTSSEGSLQAYCNTIPTQDGGTHVSGFRLALTRGLKNYGELSNNKRASLITPDDVMLAVTAMLSVFIREPEFVGQTKDKLSSVDAQRIVENAIRDQFDHWLANNPLDASKLLDWVTERADERIRRRQEKENSRKNASRRLRLPPKLADCIQKHPEGSELFIVEGDSAGGSAKQARNRANQAVLPLRGKILNVASAANDKILANQLIGDLVQSLGCNVREKYKEEDLRYDRIIIMTDADVDGAHIASLLITFFYQEMPALIANGHLYIAVPPLYRLSQGGKIAYARDDKHKDELVTTYFTGKGKIEVGRFKGLGEMRAQQLKETTMDPSKRMMLQVKIDKDYSEETRQAIDDLMGTRPEARFRFIQENAIFAENLDI